MTYSRSIFAVATAFLCMVSGLREARAITLSDVFNKSEAARSAASGARSVATTARTRATEARDAAQEIRESVRTGASTLSTTMRSAINEAVQDVSTLVDEARTGRDTFTEGPDGCSAACQAFRAEIVMLVQDVNTLMNGVFAVAGLPGMAIDAGPAVALFERIPGRALYPAYRVLALESDLFGSGLAQRLQDTADSIIVLDQVLNPPIALPVGSSSRSLLEPGVDRCEFIRDNPKLAGSAVATMSKSSLLLKVIGGVLKNLGEKAPESTIGIHGYALVTIKDPTSFKKWGERMEKVSEALGKFADTADDKIEDCTASALAQVTLESHVARCRKLVGLFLPDQQGGHLDAIDSLIAARLASAENAGIIVASARDSQSSAQAKITSGRYYAAYKDFCRAYRQVTLAAREFP